MIPNEIVEGTKVIHKHYGIGIFKGWYCHYPMIALVDFDKFTTSVLKEYLDVYK